MSAHEICSDFYYWPKPSQIGHIGLAVAACVTNKNLKVPKKPKLKCMHGFYIQWNKIVQYATTSNKGNQRPKYLQNFDEKLDMGKHPFVLVTN